MLSVREAGQVERNKVDTEFLTDKWKTEGIVVEAILFTLKEKAPLSWHLSVQDKKTVCQAWSQNGQQAKEVARFFSDEPRKPAQLNCETGVRSSY